ncbi:MAG: Outer rane autotransporter barrel protein, partial [Labilithrix sp.]|nr:Outer rane autotransporter barrel protein [Labilithrix sp.]
MILNFRKRIPASLIANSSKRLLLGTLVASGPSIAALLMMSDKSLAACAISGTDPVIVTCGTTVTTNTTNSTSPDPANSDRIQNFAADLIGSVTSGSTVSGAGLELKTSKVNGSVTFTNDGTISIPSGNAVLYLEGNGGGVTYTGAGNITGLGANSSGLSINNKFGGTSDVVVNATGGSITAVGNGVTGLGVFQNSDGNVNITTAVGHSIDLANTTSGSTNRGMQAQVNATAGGVTIDSGSNISASGGVASLGNLLGINVTVAGSSTGNIDVTSRARIDLTGTLSTSGSGISLEHQSAAGNINTTVNANITGGSTGVGVYANFANAASTGSGTHTL